MPWLTEPVRAWIYRVLMALTVLAAAYGLIAEEALVAWVGVVTAIAGNGLAVFNTSTDPDKAKIDPPAP